MSFGGVQGFGGVRFMTQSFKFLLGLLGFKGSGFGILGSPPPFPEEQGLVPFFAPKP